MKITDKQRLDWLGSQLPDGQNFRWLLCNRGYWAISEDPTAHDWWNTPRQAIDAAIIAEGKKGKKS